MAGQIDQIRFMLRLRPTTDGASEVLLSLYRGGQFASETVVSTMDETKARMILLMSRLHLFRLGYQEHVPAMPRVTHLQMMVA